MMMHVRGLVPWVLVAGCNGLLGLDPTLDEDIDFDRDGITNDLDNCPTTYNPGQENLDGDALGDACDLCIAGLVCENGGARIDRDIDGNCVDDGCENCVELDAGDEDGDGIGNRCDRCPVFADAPQPDADNDTVGDLCDVGNGFAQARKLFDGFDVDGKVNAASWIQNDWTVIGGVVESSSTTTLEAIATIQPGLQSGDWSVLVGIELDSIGDGERIELRVQSAVPSEVKPYACALTRQNESTLTLGVDSKVIFITTDQTFGMLRISNLADPSGFLCEALIEGATHRSSVVANQLDGTILKMTIVNSDGAGPHRFRHVLVID